MTDDTKGLLIQAKRFAEDNLGELAWVLTELKRSGELSADNVLDDLADLLSPLGTTKALNAAVELVHELVLARVAINRSDPSAKISDCGQYRYSLTRPCEVPQPIGPPAIFLMINPSTADAVEDDRTIGRCRGFARTWKSNGLIVANLYALRSKDPTALWTHPDPVGPENNEYLHQLAEQHRDIICAWGGDAPNDRVREVVAVLQQAGARLWCLGTTQQGAPRHPLYVKGDTERVAFSPSV